MTERLCVLKVEDHNGVRQALEQLVASCCTFDVSSCVDFLSARTIVAAGPRLDFLICGATLAVEMTGIEVAEVAVKTFLKLSVLIMSGYEQRDVSSFTGRYAFMLKSFNRKELMEHAVTAYMGLALS